MADEVAAMEAEAREIEERSKNAAALLAEKLKVQMLIFTLYLGLTMLGLAAG